MRGLVLAGVREIVLADVDEPTIVAPTDAVVAVERAGLCGSDLHTYTGAEASATGVVCGHEGIGRVLAVGAGVTGFRPGDRVIIPFTTSCGTCGMCRHGLTARCETGQLLGWAPPGDPSSGVPGCQAPLVRVPLADGTLVDLPEGVDDDTAVLLSDNMPTAWDAVDRAAVRSGGSVAIIGLGAVGLCAVTAAFAQGAGQVTAIDPVATRRAAAERLGARVAGPEEVPDLRVDSVVEAAGPSAAQMLAADIAAPGATISIIAVQTGPAFGIPPVAAYDRNLTIRCGRASVRSALDTVLPLMADGSLMVPTDVVVTHPGRPLSEGPALYAAFVDRQDGLIKATFTP